MQQTESLKRAENQPNDLRIAWLAQFRRIGFIAKRVSTREPSTFARGDLFPTRRECVRGCKTIIRSHAIDPRTTRDAIPSISRLLFRARIESRIEVGRVILTQANPRFLCTSDKYLKCHRLYSRCPRLFHGGGARARTCSLSSSVSPAF